MAKSLVSLPVAVKLVIQLKIVHIKDHQRQGASAAPAAALFQCLIKAFPVQQRSEFIGPRLAVCPLIKPGVLNGNGTYGFNGIQESDIINSQRLFLLLAAEHDDPNQIVIILQRKKTLYLHVIQAFLFLLPHSLISQGPLKIPQEQALVMLFHPAYQRMARIHSKTLVI